MMHQWTVFITRIILVLSWARSSWHEGGVAVASSSSSQNHRQIGFTHIVSTFVPPEEFLFAKAVQNSWQVAATTARREYGIDVQIINAVLERDQDSDLIQQDHDLVFLESPVVNTHGHLTPSIGEIFRKAKAYAKHQWLVYTNADIGMFPNFYEKLATLIQEKKDNDLQLLLLLGTFDMFQECVGSRVACEVAVPLCIKDATLYFEHNGGFLRDLRYMKQYILVRTMQSKKGFKCPSDTTGKRPCSCKRGLLIELLISEMETPEFLEFTQLCKENRQQPGFFESRADEIEQHFKMATTINIRHEDASGTITRLDFGGSLNGPITQALESFIQDGNSVDVFKLLKQKGVSHPGNDCFFMHVDNIPNLVEMMEHPMGLRPWGMWFADAFQFEAPHKEWRRIVGTRQDPWTFHFGVSKQVWKRQIRENGDLVLFLAARWFKLTKHQFGDLFRNIPSYCNDVKNWRDNNYCKAHPKYCRGVARLACMQYYHPRLRDTIQYTKMCTEISSNRQAVLLQPLCDFCNFLHATLHPDPNNFYPCSLRQHPTCNQQMGAIKA